MTESYKRFFNPAVVGPLGLVWFLSSCVTINIYFPAAAAERAADVIIQEILDESRVLDDSVDQHSSSIPRELSRQLLVKALDWLVPSAHAAQADLSVESAVINRLRSSMKQRFGKLKPHFDSGALGFTRDGLVALRDVSALPLPQRAQLNPLISAENRDRSALYKEIARANNHPEWEPQIRDTFARRWVSNAASGWWYQGDSGWQKK
ncbi:MAG TPA: DUF1318 domain-containing protein [Gammaproteobacteria bacterium]|nr:DUF1318 domain-containing protein [Gammaproteobacteria bacterium]